MDKVLKLLGDAVVIAESIQPGLMDAPKLVADIVGHHFIQAALDMEDLVKKVEPVLVPALEKFIADLKA